jgi:hypothetical protein
MNERTNQTNLLAARSELIALDASQHLGYWKNSTLRRGQ